MNQRFRTGGDVWAPTLQHHLATTSISVNKRKLLAPPLRFDGSIRIYSSCLFNPIHFAIDRFGANIVELIGNRSDC